MSERLIGAVLHADSLMDPDVEREAFEARLLRPLNYELQRDAVLRAVQSA
jgi:hypothetical protein